MNRQFLSSSAMRWPGVFQEHVHECVEKISDPNMTASVMLECTAGGGKLSALQVVDNTAAGQGLRQGGDLAWRTSCRWHQDRHDPRAAEVPGRS